MSTELVDRLEQEAAQREQQEAERKQAALPIYRDLLLRMATQTEQPGDDKQLCLAMKTLGLTFKTVREHQQSIVRILELRREAVELQQQISQAPDAGGEYETVKHACEDRVRHAATKVMQHNSRLMHARGSTVRSFSHSERLRLSSMVGHYRATQNCHKSAKPLSGPWITRTSRTIRNSRSSASRHVVAAEGWKKCPGITIR